MGSSASRENHPPEIQRAHPNFRCFIEVAPGFYNYRTDFRLGPAGALNIMTHMSVARLSSGDFVAIDAAVLTPEALAELNELTEDGTKLVASLHTHPFHTLAIPAFHAVFPATETRRYFGCPRHLHAITEDSAGNPIGWAGNLNDVCTRQSFLPDLDMRVPAGSEFIDPQPPTDNHFSNVFVFHPASKVVVQDDTVLYIRDAQFLMRIFGWSSYSMYFHPSIKGPGLHATPEAPLEFMAWFQQLLNDWDFEHLLSAHNGGCYGEGKKMAQELLTKSEPLLRKLSEKNAAGAGGLANQEHKSEEPMGWSETECECG